MQYSRFILSFKVFA